MAPSTPVAPIYTRIPKPIKDAIVEYAEEHGISLAEAVADHLRASVGKVTRTEPSIKIEDKAS